MGCGKPGPASGGSGCTGTPPLETTDPEVSRYTNAAEGRTQNDPMTVPRMMTVTSAKRAPTTATITMSK